MENDNRTASNRRKMYESLSKKFDIGDFDTFNKKMDNPDSQRRLYDAVKDVFDVRDFDTFSRYVSDPNIVQTRETNNITSSSQNASNKEDVEQSILNIVRQTAVPEYKQEPGLQQMVDSAKKSRETKPAYTPQVQQTDAVQALRPVVPIPIRKDTRKRDEEAEIDNTFTAMPENTEEDVYRNFYGRFSLTERGKSLQKEMADKEAEVQKKYLDEFQKSPEYLEYVGKTYTSKEEAEEADKRINELFAEKYGASIDKDMKPYQDAYYSAVIDRYGDQINEHTNSIVKRNAADQLDQLQRDIDMSVLDNKKKLKGYSANDARGALQSGYNYSMNGDVAKHRQDAGALEAANRLTEEAKEIVKEASKKGKTNFVAGLLRGFRDNAFDAEQWSMGVVDLADNTYLLNALQKFDRGEKLSDAEEKLLEASSVNMIVNAYYAQDLGRGYKAGQVNAQSLPIMFEFVVNPISASGSTLAKGLLNYAGKKMIKNFAKKKGLNYAHKKLLLKLTNKAATYHNNRTRQFLGDLGAAVGMTLTTGAAGTVADAKQRMIDNYDYSKDSGVMRIEKTGDTGFGEALGRAALARTVENQSEMIFNTLRAGRPIFKTDIISKIPVFKKLSSSDIVKLANKWKDVPILKNIRQRSQIGGTLEEYGEEVYNNIVSIATGETDYDVLSLDNNIDTFLGLIPMQLAFSSLGVGGAAIQELKSRKRVREFQRNMNPEDQAQFEEFRKAVEMGDYETVPRNYIRSIIEDNTKSDEEKRTMIFAVREEVMAHKAQEVRESQTEPEDVAYNEGQSGDIAGTANNLDRLEAEAMRITGAANQEELNELLDTYERNGHGDTKAQRIADAMYRQEGRDDEAVRIMLDYLNADAKFKGASNYVMDRVDEAVEEENGKIDVITHKGGFIQPATMKNDHPVYITSGNIVTLPDGTIDREKSDQDIIVFDQTTGKLEFTTADQILEMGIQSNPEELKAQNAEIVSQQIISESEMMMNAQVVEETQQDALSNEPETITQQENQGTLTEETNQAQEIPVDEEGEPIFTGVDPNLAIDYIYNQSGLEEQDADEFVNQKIAESAKNAAGIEKKKPKIGSKIGAYRRELAAWEAERDAAQEELNYWTNIQNQVIQSRNQPATIEQQNISDVIEPDVPDVVNDKAIDARARGYRMVNGYRVDRPSPVRSNNGAETEIRFSTKDAIPGRFAVVEAGSLQPSHVNGQRNPYFFINEAQPKDRVDDASIKAADDIASAIRPEEITGGVTAYTGSPVVNTRGEVVQGNNRSAALRTMYQSNAEQSEIYKNYLRNHAADYGLTEEQVDEMEQPVLVRIADVSDVQAIRLGQMTAQDTESGGIERIKPVQTYNKMGDSAGSFVNILLNSEDENSSLADLVAENGVAALKYLAQKQAISDTQYQSAFDRNGNLTPEAKQDLTQIIEASLFEGGPDLLPQMFRTLPAKSQKAILSTFSRDRNSEESKQIRKDIHNAIQVFYEAMQDADFASATNYESARRALESWKRQINMMDGVAPMDKFDNFAIELAARFKGNTMKRTAEEFNAFYDLVQGEQDLFSESGPVSKNEAINQIYNINESRRENAPDVENNTGRGEERGSGSNRDGSSGELNPEGERTADTGRGTVVALTESPEKANENRMEQIADRLSEIEYRLSELDEEPGMFSEAERISLNMEKFELESEYNGLRTTNAISKAIQDAEAEVNQNPTEAQKDAGNYKKGHLKLDGYDITIENPKGSERSGTDKNGTPWSITMNNTYGYIRGTESVDGDHIDVFLSDNPSEGNVFVVDQIDQETGEFDEHKVMYGFNSIEEAKDAYLSNYSEGWKIGTVTEVSKDEFKKWISSSKRKTKPFAEYHSVKPISGESGFVSEDKKELLLEDIDNSPFDEEMKDGARAYLNGIINFATAIAYNNISNYVRNRTENNESDSQGTGGTQLDGETDGAGSAEVGPSGNETDQVDRVGSGENVSESGVRGTDSIYGPSVSDGERGNNEVRGEEPGNDGISSGRSNTKRSRKPRSNGDNVRSTGRRKSGKQNDGEDTKRRNTAKSERDSVLDEINSLLDDFVKAGNEGLSLSVVGMNSKQIEIAGKILVAGVRLGYTYIKDGIYKFNAWRDAMRGKLSVPFSQAMKLTDPEIDEFIEDMWNYPHTIDGETKLLKEWAAEMEHEELRNQVRMTINEKKKMQEEAESIPVQVGNMQNIVETLPYLLPQQQEDVYKAEIQFFDPSHSDREHGFGKGYLFTNGTGTGKTYTGLGIVKRFIKQGKSRVLILTPSQQKVLDWTKDAKNLGIDLKPLKSTKDKGEGAVITTFANLRTNMSLMEDAFDLVVYDESHRIMENKNADETIGARQHYMLSNKNEDEAIRRLQSIHPLWIEQNELIKEMSSLDKMMADLDMMQEEYAEKDQRREEIQNRLEEIKELQDKEMPEMTEKAKEAVQKTKTVFLSATPFNTIPSLAYTEGYIFSYPEENQNTIGSYNHRSPRESFLERHFGAGYRFRYGRIENHVENPEALSQQEVQFSDYLENDLGTKSGRIIDSEYDYSRDFPTVTVKIAPLFNGALEDVFNYQNNEFSELRDAFRSIFYDYNYSTALFETMKIAAIVPRIKEHLKKGRKVVVFHRRVTSKNPLQPPFRLALDAARAMAEMIDTTNDEGKDKKKKTLKQIADFEKKYDKLLNYEQTLNYEMPREQLAEVFGRENVLYFSGKETKKVKDEAVNSFNDDNSGKDIIVIQEASGKEGISLHDTTGNHQRVLITLALPQSPITALQIEGRTYRIGNKSNAIFEYPLLGLNLETTIFGSKFNQQVSTTENLALGSKARNLRTSFAEGVLQHSGDIPLENQGIGGKEFDNEGKQQQDGFDKSVLDYYGTQKLRGKRNERAGIDYYPTPEPIGYKMVEWARLMEGEDVLEPSAGHGAIARYVPRINGLTAIEPSQDLFSLLQLRAGGTGRKFVDDIFENYNLVNKFDAVLMNPPYGSAGRTAIDHVEKAFNHLNEGGRVIAIIPRGSADQKFDKWLEKTPAASFVGEILLPSVTFSRAGTSVNTRIVIIDKVSRDEAKSKVPTMVSRDLTYVDKIEGPEGLFEALRDIEMPHRTIDQVAIDMKNAKKTVKDFKDIKGVETVDINENGIDVDGRFPKYISLSWNDFRDPKRYESYARQFEMYSKENTKKSQENAEFFSVVLKTFQNVNDKTHEQLIDSLSDNQSSSRYKYVLDQNTRTGNDMHLAEPVVQGSLSDSEYKQVLSIAKKHNGYWNKFKKAFHFETEEDAKKFISEQNENNNVRFRIGETGSGILNKYERGQIVLEQYRDKEINSDNVNLALYDLFGVFAGRLYENGVLGNVLKEATINEEKAKEEYERAEIYLNEYATVLNDLKGNSTEAAKAIIDEEINDINKAVRYYKDLADGKDVWRWDSPRFRSISKLNISKQSIRFGKMLGTGITIANTVEEIENAKSREAIENGRNVKGWFEPSTGKVVLYMPNIENEADAQATILHETVGHKGLRELFGARFDKFLYDVFSRAEEPIRRQISRKMMQPGSYGRVDVATEEYLAEMAERGFKENERGFWNMVKRLFSNLLHEARIRLGFTLRDSDLRYILWRSYQLQRERGALAEAANIAMKQNLGLNEAPQEVRFRISKEQRDNEYDNALKGWRYKFQEAYQDSMLALKKLQEIISKITGPILDSENAYMAENQLSSKNKIESEIYRYRFFNPMIDAVTSLIRKSRRSYEDILKYLIAKHGLERNRVFALRDAIEATENPEETRKKINEQISILLKEKESKKLDEKAYKKALEEMFQKLAPEYKNFRKRDYSGLKALTGEKKDFENAALQIVEEMDQFGTKDLWDAINKATKETLRKSYESGMMNRAQYDYVSNMFEYYVPLRGWSEDVASDVYEYFTTKDNSFNPTLKRAGGRDSLADDPLANIGNMAESAILQGNRNLMKQKFLNMVLNHKNKYATVKDMWYKNEGTKKKPIWKESIPDIPEDATAEKVNQILEEHEALMKELQKERMAKKRISKLDVGYRTTKKERKEHIVRVKRNGKDYLIYINGNPRAAQAINGLTNPDSQSRFWNGVNWINRQLSANFTSRNPAFVLTNLSRDLIFAGTAVAIKEDYDYVKAYTNNIKKILFQWKTLSLIRNFDKGKIGNSPMEQYFKEFLENGGETGYTQLMSVDEFKKIIRKEINLVKEGNDKRKAGDPTSALNAATRWVETFNRSAEDMTRFAVYMTSRQMGRSIQRSVSDAKEITVNFNKKGSGALGARYFKYLYVFFNAAVQSLTNFGRLAKNNPKKFTAMIASTMAAGFIIPMANILVMAAMGDDDDKDAYFNLPEWVRRNNLVFYIPGTEGRFLTIPLPIEMRVFYGLGELFLSYAYGRETGNVGLEIMKSVSDLSPVDLTGHGGEGLVSLALNLMPSFAAPIVEIAANKDYFGIPIYKDTDYNKEFPEWTKAYGGTNKTLVKMAEGLNQLTGGDKYKKGWLNINPAIVEHLFDSYFGGLGKTINQVGKSIASGWYPELRESRNYPVINRFYSKVDEKSGFRSVNERFYKYMDEFKETQKNFNGYKKDASMGAFEYAEKLSELVKTPEFKRYNIIRIFNKEMNGLKQAIKESPDMDSKSKLENLYNLEKARLVEMLDKINE